MTLLPAFDVSTWQHGLGSLAGYRLGITRATWDVGADPQYNDHIAAIKGSGLVGGAYHAGYGDKDGALQAAAFLLAIALGPKQPDILAIDTREFGMSVGQCNQFITYCRDRDPLKRPIGIYDSEGNWTGPYVAHDFEWVANYSRIPTRKFAIWQDAAHGGAGGGDHDWVDGQWLDKLGLGRAAPLWKTGPIDAEVNMAAGKPIYKLDGRSPYSKTTAPVTFKAPGLAPGWTMILDGSVYAAVRNADLAAIT